MSDLRNAVARDRDDWMQSDEGLMCQIGTAADQYLRNRLERAFLAGHEKGRARGVRAGLEAAKRQCQQVRDSADEANERKARIGADACLLMLCALSDESIAKEAADAAE